MISRHQFLALTGGALLAQSARAAVPRSLDHIILRCAELERGIAYVEKHTGVRAAFGGVHPGRGTHNALLSLGGRSYLEILAPDPKQAQPSRPEQIPDQVKEAAEPHLVGWGIHPGDVMVVAKRLRDAGVNCQGPNDGSRARPDGRTLRWKRLNLADNPQGLLPFFIEWSAESAHPSADSPSGCRLVNFAVVSPEPGKLAKIARLIGKIGMEMPIVRGEKPELRGTIAGPRGKLALTSRSPQ